MSAALRSAFNARAGIAVAAFALASCGIDQGGSSEPIANNPPPLGQTLLVSGPIDAFGSVHVNGLVLDTARAQIRVDGRAATQADLRVGQMIRAVALVANGSAAALSIDYEQNVVGPIASIDPIAGEFSVLGQTVRVTAATRFDGWQLFRDLQVGDRIVVSGITLPGHRVLATYVARSAATEPLQVTTSISSLSPLGSVFNLGSLAIDYSRAALLEFPNGMPTTNLMVEVTGTALAGNTLIADRVRALPLAPGTFTAAATTLTNAEVPSVVLASSEQPQAVDFVGVITVRALDTLWFDDLEVIVTPTTLIVGGGTSALVAGARVEVEGRILALGRVEATRIAIQ
jgi:hypothetical protein